MTNRFALAFGACVLAVAVGCDSGSVAKSPTPFPTLLPLLTSTPASSATPAASESTAPSASPSAVASASGLPLLVLPEEFTKIPSGRNTYKYEAKSKGGILAKNTPKNIRLGHCGILMPVDVDGSLWDAAYGHDGQGGPLTDAQLGDLRNDGRVTITLLDDGTLQMVTRHGAFITFTRHEGSRRYGACA